MHIDKSLSIRPETSREVWIHVDFNILKAERRSRSSIYFKKPCNSQGFTLLMVAHSITRWKNQQFRFILKLKGILCFRTHSLPIPSGTFALRITLDGKSCHLRLYTVVRTKSWMNAIFALYSAVFFEGSIDLWRNNHGNIPILISKAYFSLLYIVPCSKRH